MSRFDQPPETDNPLTGYLMASIMVSVGLMTLLAAGQINASRAKKMIADLESRTELCEKKLNTETKRRTRNYERAHH